MDHRDGLIQGMTYEESQESGVRPSILRFNPQRGSLIGVERVKTKYFFLPVLFAVLAFFGPSRADAKGSTAKTPIRPNELLSLFRAGKPIANREIQGDDIIEVLKWAYDDAIRNGFID